VFHFVYCRDGRGISGRAFAERCEETVAFEELGFEPPIAELDSEWTAVDAVYDRGKRPIQFARHVGGECVRFVDAAIAKLTERGFAQSSGELIARLKATNQVFEIEFDEMLADDDVWEFLDIIETYFASERDGLIYTADEGFFDEDNKPVRAFQ
jgi:hypothetical protein